MRVEGEVTLKGTEGRCHKKAQEEDGGWCEQSLGVRGSGDTNGRM